MKTKIKIKTKILVAVVVGLSVGLLIFAGLSKVDFFAKASVTQSTTIKFKDSLPTWASDSIYRLNSAGIITGYANGKFGAADNLTRGQVVTLLYRTLKYKNIIQEPDTTKCTSYNDVKSTDYYYLPVCLVTINTGSDVFGNDSGTFDPNTLVTRAEVAKLVDSMLGDTFLKSMDTDRETSVSFQDVQKDNSYFNSAALMHTTGLMLGKQDGAFDPNGLLNRAEMSVIMDRTLNLLESLQVKELVKQIGDDVYMAECASLITQQTTSCSRYTNWFLDIQVFEKNTKTHKSDVEFSYVKSGPGNECDSSKAGEVFPAEFKSAYLNKEEFGAGDDVKILCRVSCTGWDECPTDQERTTTCTGGAMKTSDCLSSCDGTCQDSEDQENCSICVPCDDTTDTGTDSGTNNQTSSCGEQPVYNCSQCNGLPSYPTFAYEDCLTSCNNAFQNASIQYNQCLDQQY